MPDFAPPSHDASHNKTRQQVGALSTVRFSGDILVMTIWRLDRHQIAVFHMEPESCQVRQGHNDQHNAHHHIMTAMRAFDADVTDRAVFS